MRKLAEYYKALSDENRLKIIKMLSEKEMCVCEIIDQLDMSQPAISHHLKILRQAGIIKDSREGKWIYYSLEKENISKFEAEFKNITESNLGENQTIKRTDCSTCEILEAKHKPLKEVL